MEYLVIPKTKINVMNTLINNARNGFNQAVDIEPIELANGDFCLPMAVKDNNDFGQFTTLINSQNPTLFSIQELSQNDFKVYTE